MLNEKSIELLFLRLAPFWANIEAQSFVEGRSPCLLRWVMGGRYFHILFGINHENQEVKDVWEKK